MGGYDRTRDFFRLFMAPGMGHCAGGPGPNQFDAVIALEQWVERGVAPDILLATHSTAGKVDRTRPLCPYPQVARYKGVGSIDDAASFSCAAPGPPNRPTSAANGKPQ
jgi:feruloyl esterase